MDVSVSFFRLVRGILMKLKYDVVQGELGKV